ncbi:MULTISPECIES: hypothetical protein [Streptomyces]|uniref:hypothetical protein n=1 Tax=Streptomyces TaxID=1883 RepID=UPI00340C78BF
MKALQLHDTLDTRVEDIEEPALWAGTIKVLVSSRTVLRWHARLVAKKWTYPRRRPGRPTKPEALCALVLRLAPENDGWGCRRIHGELLNLGWKVAASTVWEISQQADIAPAPQRADRSRARFLQVQAQGILAAHCRHLVPDSGQRRQRCRGGLSSVSVVARH